MNKLSLWFWFLALVLFVSCNEDKALPDDDGLFNSLDASHTGIDFSNDLVNDEKQNIIEYLYFYNGGGVAVGDLNGDDLEDVYFTANQKGDQLYINKGDLTFEKSKAGVEGFTGWSSGVTMDDVNGDGHLDIYVCKVVKMSPDPNTHNLLFINDGKGNFEEKSGDYGLDFRGFSTQSCFIDYDKDGDLDMYLMNHAVHTVRSYGDTKKRTLLDPVSGDRFFENRLKEEGKFVDVTQEAKIYSSPLGYGLAITAADVNNDGWTDIYVGNDFHENDYLYINNGDKTFTESREKYFTNTTQFSMGVDMMDMNNDGIADVFSTDMMPYDPKVMLKSGGEDSDQIKRIKDDLGFELQNARNHFQLNSRSGQFSDVSFITKTYATDWSWSVLLQDYDNDLAADIFITNGIVGRPNDLDYINYLNANPEDQNYESLVAQMPKQPLHNLLFLNQGNLKYSAHEDSKLGAASFSNGAAYADLDKDGDLDLIVNNINQDAFVLENNASANANYLSVQLVDSAATAKGALVELYAGKNKLQREFQTTKGFQSSVSHHLHFGLGELTKIDSLIVVWPDNQKQVIKEITINTQLKVSKDSSNDKYKRNKSNTASALALPFAHEENKFYDENYEKLIPERFGYEGPALICEDLNDDGIKDLYIGGARNRLAYLLLGTKDGSFVNKSPEVFESESKYEDIAAATIDFDGDGDRDIYVVSGGNDNKELDKVMEDRLYLNNGGGVFKRIPISLPHTNGSCIAVADVDKDGFEDLFIGASTIPGSYGLSPYSFLLRNNSGQALEIIDKQRYGMVKDAVFADIEGDGDADLVMCGDWMSPRVLINEGGKFEDKTLEYGLNTAQGFWNTVEVADVDGDGKKDILAGNAGLNTKWTATEAEPIKLYVGDFDKNGSSEPIIFHNYFGRYIPFASLDKLTSQLPMLKKKFTSYKSFEDVSQIENLLENPGESIVEEKYVTELRSMLFKWNAGMYEAIPLNMEEQLSAINDFEFHENGEVYYVGNDAQYVAELGPSMSRSGGMFYGFDKTENRFMNSSALNLPNNLDAKRIKFLAKDRAIILSNGDYPRIVKIN